MFGGIFTLFTAERKKTVDRAEGVRRSRKMQVLSGRQTNDKVGRLYRSSEAGFTKMLRDSYE